MLIIDKNKCRIPTVTFSKIDILDMVGVGCSTLRQKFIHELLQKNKPTVLKGNLSEWMVFLGQENHVRGVDVSAADQKRSLDDILPPLCAYVRQNKVIALMKSLSGQWFFVPEDTEDVPPYIYSDRVIRIEAEEDETWTYDSLDITCFSLRIPVYGSRHSDKGVLADKASLGNYVKALEKILRYW